MKRLLLVALSAAIAVTVLAEMAGAFETVQRRCAQWPCWHHPYYSASWGMPVSIVVPPTAELQTHWGWGIGATRVTPICSQYQRNYPGPGQYDRRLY